MAVERLPGDFGTRRGDDEGDDVLTPFGVGLTDDGYLMDIRVG